MIQTEHSGLEWVAAVAADLRQSFRAGKTQGIEWRLQQLNQIKRMLIENKEKIIAALKADLRQTDLIASTEVDSPLKDCQQAIKNLSTWMKPEPKPIPMINKPGSGLVMKEPYGAVLIIAPWNYPISLILKPLIGAVAAGNVVCLKPSEISVNSSKLLADLIPKYLDPTCISLVEGAVEETTALLKEKWDYILYTGNGQVGRIIMRAAAEHLTPVTLELGGKSPVIIDDTANLDVAARRLCWAKFTINSGQTCVAPDYILVTKGVEKPLLEKMKATLKEFYGDDVKSSKDYSRMINQRHTKRVASLIDGQNVFLGGEVDEEDCFISPTILTNVDTSSKVMQEEIFGPVLPVLPVTSVEEAIEFVNARPKPLALYVFSESKQTQDQVLNNTSSGGVSVNDAIMHVVCPELPFGGVGESGMGAYNGKYTFETFTHHKAVLKRGTWSDPSLRYPPFTENKIKWINMLNGGIKLPSKLTMTAIFLAPVVAYGVYRFVTNPTLFGNSKL